MKPERTHAEEILQHLLSLGLEDKYSKAGIYSISIGSHLVYIGKARNMLVRISQHLAEIEKARPKSNKYKVLHEAHQKGLDINFDVLYYSTKKQKPAIDRDIGTQEAKLINQYQPVLNYQIPNTYNYTTYTVNREAKTITLKEILK